MSVPFRRGLLSAAFESHYSRELLIYPKSAYNTDNIKYVKCHKVDAVNGQDVIYLPFQYARFNCGCVNDKISTHLQSSISGDVPVYDYQLQAAKDAVVVLNAERTVLLFLRPGKGKTRISCYLTTRIKMKTVILVESSTLLSQWKSEIEDTMQAAIWIVGEKKPKYYDIVICLNTRTKKIPASERAEIGLVVIDECHRFCNQTGIDAILDFTPKFIVACSATPKRYSDGMDIIMEHVIGKKFVIVPDVIVKKVVTISTGFRAEVQYRAGKGGRKTVDWTILYQSLIYNNERNAKIVQLAKLLVADQHKLLMLTNETSHAKDYLHPMLVEQSVSSDWFCDDKKTYQDSSCLVGNMQKCGTGFDEKAHHKQLKQRMNILFRTVSVKDRALSTQLDGRVERSDNPVIFHFVDDNDIVRKHFENSMKNYRGSGKKTVTETEYNGVAKTIYYSYDSSLKREQTVTVYDCTWDSVVKILNDIQ